MATLSRKILLELNRMLKPFILFMGIILILNLAQELYASDSISVLKHDDLVGGPAPAGWQIKPKDGQPQTYILTEGERRSFCMTSNNASFSIEREVNIDIRKYPILFWRWKVLKLPPNGDFRKRNLNDQAAQLFVGFKGLPSKSISYIWDSNAPLSATGEEHWVVVKVKIMVVESGNERLGKWVSMERNIYNDFQKLFGKNVPNVVDGIRFQINSQHTKSMGESCIESIEFKEDNLN